MSEVKGVHLVYRIVLVERDRSDIVHGDCSIAYWFPKEYSDWGKAVRHMKLLHALKSHYHYWSDKVSQYQIMIRWSDECGDCWKASSESRLVID